MIRLYKTPWLLKKLLPGYTWHREVKDQKVLYITFDDGPIPEVTPWVVDQLAKYNAKATFFCVGENLRKHPEVAMQVMQAGHLLANHTYNHLKGWQTPLATYVQNTAQCQKELDKLQQSFSNLFRPPYGRISKAQASQLRATYELIMWDVLTNDYDQSLGPEKCLRKSIESTQSGSIIVFHDSLKAKRNMMYVLPRYLDHFAQQGYMFESL
ncbi:polysaccharide deacetylase family protein [Pontibacter oryzae]|uniref:Polysaccharide deacetylase family protein n=1 Tax=Pontibacter oryzae TaxID=2304593 RepID=A0A399RV91_9BACT|nr:polysaccharide deacetylase family protein [Pontibacter oryzae]RIJ34224.1 polysaccharide deacetylase family protein [Pontibacter oryzae]